MKIKSGIDLVYLPRFKKSLKSGGENFIRRVFNNEEVSDFSTRGTRGTSVEHLAGIFAAKEAVMKALSLPTDSWLEILITYKSNGSPEVQIRNSKFEIRNSSVSISHDGDYVIAQFVAILEE